MLRIAFALACVFSLAVAGEAENLRREIRDLEFLNRIGLSRAQAAALLPIAQRGAVIRREIDREQDFVQVKLHGALQKFREEDLRDALSPESMALAGGLEHAQKLLGMSLVTRLDVLERDFADRLSTAQRARIYPGTAGTHPLDRLRKLRGSDFLELRDRLARELSRARARAGVVQNHQKRAERLRLQRELHRLKGWDDSQYALQRDALLDQLLPGRRRAEIAAAIRAIYRQKYGQAGPLAEHLFRVSMLPVIAERACLPEPILPPLKSSGRSLPGDMDRLRSEVAALKADINLLNLMNGMHFDRDQLHGLVKATKRCEAVQIEWGPATDARTLAAMREMRDLLRAGDPVPTSLRKKMLSPAARRGSGYLRVKRNEYEQVRSDCVERVFAALSPEQREVLRTYKSCLVPPKDLRDPVRAGQANDTGELERLVDALRRVRLDEGAEEVVERLLQRVELHEGRFPPEERHCKRMLLLGVAYEAQTCDDVGFATRKHELAQRLVPLQRLSRLKEELHEMEGATHVVQDQVRRFLLAPRMRVLAEDRRARLKNPEAIARPDLPKADNCDGDCGSP